VRGINKVKRGRSLNVVEKGGPFAARRRKV